MGEVVLNVAGRSHSVMCRDGEEPHVRKLGDMLERHSPTALRAAGGAGSERALLFIALILADEIAEMRSNPPSGLSPDLLERLADRLDAVASALEDDAAAS